VGALRCQEHCSVPEIHSALGDSARLRKELAVQDRVVLALDGLQPDVGPEVLWVLRDGLSSQVLLARSLLSRTCEDLAQLLRQALQPLGKIAVVGVISDGQDSIRRAVAQELPGVPHQLCQFHFLREAALAVFEGRPPRQEAAEGPSQGHSPHRALGRTP
jgi:hypothetical protein